MHGKLAKQVLKMAGKFYGLIKLNKASRNMEEVRNSNTRCVTKENIISIND